MFFNIGSQILNNFPNHHQHGNLWFNFDNGWSVTEDSNKNKIFFKGYTDVNSLELLLPEICNQEEPLHTGNFCVIKCFNKGITIKTDRCRSFPLWYDKKAGISNLNKLSRSIWTDSFVSIMDDGELIESKFDLIPVIDTSPLTFAQVVDKVDDILTLKVKNFIKFNHLPLKSFLTGGIDTGLLYSYLHKLKVDNQLITYTHMDFDYFYMKNHVTLMNFWGYNQIHHWKDSCVILTGAPGDEFTVRSPTTANMMLRYYRSSIPELIKKYSNALHREYFLLEEYTTIWEEQKDLFFNNLEEAIRSCVNLISNDYQHWHLGNTLTWTPLKDIELFTTIARLGVDDLENQIMNSSIQKELIKRNFPELLDCLSNNKNSGNYMENLVNIIN